MRTTIFGKTGLEVSRLALGTWEFSGAWGKFDEDHAAAIVRRACDLGINFFDTAHEYGFGEAERILGGVIRSGVGRDRDELIVATKGGLRPTETGPQRDASPEWLRQDVDSSLKALSMDHIDIYQIHWPDPAVPAAETAGALAELIDEGKIRHAGVSNYSTEQVKEFSAVLPVESVQPPYSMFRREIEHDLLPYCTANNIGVVVYGPLSHGLLTGTITADTEFSPEDWRSRSPVFAGDDFVNNLEIVDQLKPLAHEMGVTLSQLAIAWTLAQPGIDVAITGAQHIGYLQDSAGAADVTLTDDDVAAIEEIIACAIPVSGPYPEMWQEWSEQDPHG